MATLFSETPSSDLKKTRQLLEALHFPMHRTGYTCLCIGIPRFREDPQQFLSKELYPYIASQIGANSPEAVEQAIREAIHNAWAHRDPAVWEQYFPGAVKAPSNKQFIATMAGQLS